MMLLLSSLALASGGGEHDVMAANWKEIALTAINLGLFLILLVWFVRRPVMDALHTRSNKVRQELDEAQRLHDEAQARYAEIDQKLQTLDQRIEAMKAEAEQSAAIEAARVAERADADAARIRDTAERTIREETLRARNAIRQEAVDAAARLAADHLRRNVSADDQARLASALLGSVKGEA